jgi:hypothetical protein
VLVTVPQKYSQPRFDCTFCAMRLYLSGIVTVPLRYTIYLYELSVRNYLRIRNADAFLLWVTFLLYAFIHHGKPGTTNNAYSVNPFT